MQRNKNKIDDLLFNVTKLYPKYIDLNLSRLEKLLQKLDNPQDKLPPVIHIAGTNGKGSTLIFIKNIMEEYGLKVHCYTSPHLIRFNERIVLSNKQIQDDDLFKTLNEVIKINNNKEPIIGCLGLAYKPDVDDIRNSPALSLVKSLKKEGFKINLKKDFEFLKKSNFQNSIVICEITLENELQTILSFLKKNKNSSNFIFVMNEKIKLPTENFNFKIFNLFIMKL